MRLWHLLRVFVGLACAESLLNAFENLLGKAVEIKRCCWCPVALVFPTRSSREPPEGGETSRKIRLELVNILKVEDAPKLTRERHVGLIPFVFSVWF